LEEKARVSALSSSSFISECWHFENTDHSLSHTSCDFVQSKIHRKSK
jgi:hypothetical protein